MMRWGREGRRRTGDEDEVDLDSDANVAELFI